MLLDEEHPYDCSKHKCLTNTDEITVTTLGITETITKDNYERFFEKVKRQSNDQGNRSTLPYWVIIEQADFCPRFLFNDLMYDTVRCYNLCDGLNVKTPEELDDTLGLWVDACSIIGSQQQKWLTVKATQEANKHGKK